VGVNVGNIVIVEVDGNAVDGDDEDGNEDGGIESIITAAATVGLAEDGDCEDIHEIVFFLASSSALESSSTSTGVAFETRSSSPSYTTVSDLISVSVSASDPFIPGAMTTSVISV
jgi:hypothetical protein